MMRRKPDPVVFDGDGFNRVDKDATACPREDGFARRSLQRNSDATPRRIRKFLNAVNRVNHGLKRGRQRVALREINVCDTTGDTDAHSWGAEGGVESLLERSANLKT